MPHTAWPRNYRFIYIVMDCLTGNCDWKNTTTENCLLPPPNLTQFQTDPSCSPPCGEKESCYEENCEDATNCILECSSCSDLRRGNPCLGLFNTAFCK